MSTWQHKSTVTQPPIIYQFAILTSLLDNHLLGQPFVIPCTDSPSGADL